MIPGFTNRRIRYFTSITDFFLYLITCIVASNIVNYSYLKKQKNEHSVVFQANSIFPSPKECTISSTDVLETDNSRLTLWRRFCSKGSKGRSRIMSECQSLKTQHYLWFTISPTTKVLSEHHR